MRVPMDKSFDISSRERAQHLYNKNAELAGRRRRPAQAKIPSDPNAWQQMRENYEAIILGDHAFTEQLEIEYALWQLHYRRIEDLRAQLNASLNSSPADAPQSAKGSTRPSDRISRIRSKFRSFLSEASGFYHDLLLKIRAKHGLPLGYFSDDTGNQIILSEDSNRSAGTKKGLVSCHHCLIYLGDLARYKGMYGEGGSKSRDFTAASSYYIQASSLWPSSGNPHHQLAILASYSGDELEAVYHYFRSLAVDNPFATARDNLVIAFEKNRQRYSQFSVDVKTSAVKSPALRMTAKGRGKGEAKLFLKDSQPEKASVNEGESSIFETFKTFCVRFVRLNGILFTRTSLEMFDEVFSFALGDFMELLASGPEDGCNFGPNLTENRVAIVRLVAILIFTVHNVNKENDNQSYAEILQRSVLLQNASTSTFKFMSHILERCVQLRDLSISYLLPGVLVFIEWLACHQDIVACCDLEEKQANARLNFWNNCILFLNKILSSGFMSIAEDEDETCFYNMCRYDEEETANRLALWEDFELRGFLPLVPAQLILDFSRKHNFGSEGGRKEVKARLERIVAAGKALANVVQVGKQSIHFDPKLKKFSIGAKPQISEDALISAIEIPSTSGMGQEHVTDRAKNSRETQPKLNMEAEEEDEIIVFKPSVVDKNNDPVAPSTSSDEIFVPDFDASRAEVRSYVGSASSLCNGSILQNASGANITTSELLSSTTRQHLQPFQPSSSKWLVDQQLSLSNGVKDLNLVGNGLVVKPQMQEHLHLQQPTLQLPSSELVPNHSAFSLSSYSVNPNGSTMFTSHAPQFPYMDPLVSSRATFDSFPAKHVPAFPRKNPISRPVRHFGPPPGFNLVPSRDVDECLPDAALEDENMPMDDYSWLDEYHLPLSDKGNGFNNFINRSTQDGCNNLIGHASKNSSSAASVMFPFPGKQVPPFQAQLGNHKKWLDYQIADHLKPFEGHQSQHQNGNQQSILLPEHHEEKSIWEGCSFV